MTTETRTELDAQTIEELRPVCDLTTVRPGTSIVLSRCDQPAIYVVRIAKPCGCERSALRCFEHLAGYGKAMNTCPTCLSRFPTADLRILSVEPIGGKS